MAKHVIGAPLIDTSLVLWAAGGSDVTASGVLGLGCDLAATSGLSLASTVDGDAVMLADILMDLSNVNVADGNETYTIRLFGANVPDFSVKQIILSYEVGRAAVIGTAKRLGRHRIPFRNWALDDSATAPAGGGVYTSFRYVRLEAVLAGTTPILNGSAYIVPIQSIGK